MRRRPSKLHLAWVLLATGAPSVWACATAAESEEGSPDRPTTGGTTFLPGVPGGGSGGKLNEPACAQVTLPAQHAPLEMSIVLDQSVSMNAPPWASRWRMARDALLAFADAAPVPRLSLALTLVPAPYSDECLAASYAEPQVEMRDARDAAARFKDWLAVDVVTGMKSPFRPALAGAHKYLADRLDDDPSTQGVVVIVTNGGVNSCNSTVESVAEVAADGLAGSPPVPTFVVTLEGSIVDELLPVAQAGGTEEVIVVGSGTQGRDELIGALESIRRRTLSCDLLLPRLSWGEIDPDTVQVRVQESRDVEPLTLPQLERVERCAGGTDGFYFMDDERTRMKLCPASCAIAQAAGPEAELSLDVSCVELVR